MAQFKKIQFPEDTTFYTAITHDGLSGNSDPNHIVEEFSDYNSAWEYIYNNSDPDSDSVSILIKRDDFGGEWVEILDDLHHNFYIYPAQEVK